MGKDNHHQDIKGPFTEEEKKYIRLAHEEDELMGHHHHHHHHEHVNYERPKSLTVPIGLFALRKLDTIEPEYFSVQQKRLLKAVAPGFASYLMYACFLSASSIYSMYLYNGMGFKGFVSKGVIPLVGILGTYKVLEYVVNIAREQYFAKARKQFVKKYEDKFGTEYILDILNPTFRLDAPIEE